MTIVANTTQLILFSAILVSCDKSRSKEQKPLNNGIGELGTPESARPQNATSVPKAVDAYPSLGIRLKLKTTLDLRSIISSTAGNARTSESLTSHNNTIFGVIFVDSTDTVLVPERTSGVVYRIGNSGAILSRLVPPQATSTRNALEIVPFGNDVDTLYVDYETLTNGHTVLEFSKDGQCLGPSQLPIDRDTIIRFGHDRDTYVRISDGTIATVTSARKSFPVKIPTSKPEGSHALLVDAAFANNETLLIIEAWSGSQLTSSQGGVVHIVTILDNCVRTIPIPHGIPRVITSNRDWALIYAAIGKLWVLNIQTGEFKEFEPRDLGRRKTYWCPAFSRDGNTLVVLERESGTLLTYQVGS
jgi:hypothetical protein